MTLTFTPAVLVAFMLALVRASAWIAVGPPFNTKMIPVQVKIGISGALALAATPHLATTIDPTKLGTAELVGAVTLQVITGLTIGFIANMLISAVMTAGSLIDLFGGFTMARAFDPLSNSQSTMFSRVYQLLATTLLFAIDGHLLLVRGFLSSFNAVGMTGMRMAGLSDLLIKGIGTLFVSAIEIAGPLLAALFLTDVVLGLLSRAAPQLNVFALGFPLKILVTLLLAGIALPLLPDAVSRLLHDAVNGGLGLVR